MPATARLAAHLGSLEPLTLESIRAVREGAKRIRDYLTLDLADAALREHLTCKP